MIGVLLAVAQFMVLGVPAAWLLDPKATRRRLMGTAFLLGAGIVSVILLTFSIVGVEWTLVRVTIACGVVTIGLFAGLLPRRRIELQTVAASPRKGIAAWIVDLATASLVLSHAMLATITSVSEWDFWAIWGLKARVFLERGAIDWAFLEHPFHLFAHPDYPPLLSLDYVFVSLRGGWDDRWLGILTTCFAGALLLIIRDAFEEELPAVLAALATLAIASLPLTRWIGMAEAPMIAFGVAGLLMIRRHSFPLGAVLLGFAAMTKNEGLALLVAVLLAMALSARRNEMVRLWPAFVIASPWLFLRALHSLSTDLAAGAVGARAARNLARLPEIMSALIDSPPTRPVYWIAVATALLFCVREVHRERFVLLAVLFQLLFFVGAYVVTPNDLRWHIVETWPRLLDQVGVALGFAALVLLGRPFLGPRWKFVDSSG